MKINALDKFLPPNDLFRAETLCWLPFYFSKDFHLLGRKLLESIQYNFDLFEALSRSFMNDFDVSDSLLKAKVPIFSIWSTSDRIISFEYSDKTSRKFPHIPFSYVDDAGHFPFVEKPNEVKHLIELFVSKIQKEEN